MRMLIGCLIALLLGACASLPKPLPADVAARLKQGKTAVLFYDDISQINYIEDKYFVLGVAQVASSSAYTGIWNSNAELSKLHAAQLGGLGLTTQPAYELLSASYIEENTVADRALYTLKPRDKSQPVPQIPKPGKALSPKLRDALMAQDQDSLIWVSWSGFTYHLLTLGLPPQEQMTTGFWVFDLKENRQIWHGALFTLVNVDKIGDQTAKQFLESNDLSGLKTEVAKRINDYYRADQRKNGNLGVLMGLTEVAQ